MGDGSEARAAAQALFPDESPHTDLGSGEDGSRHGAPAAERIPAVRDDEHRKRRTERGLDLRSQNFIRMNCSDSHSLTLTVQHSTRQY